MDRRYWAKLHPKYNNYFFDLVVSAESTKANQTHEFYSPRNLYLRAEYKDPELFPCTDVVRAYLRDHHFCNVP
jgi:hypothetical protein